MPARALLISSVLLAVPGVFAGCADHLEQSGSRPQRLISAAPKANRFVGDWGPSIGYVANDWIVRFMPDGRISVRGPGMTARGTYVATDRLAQVAYSVRDGGRASEALMHGEFSLSPDGQELTFSTGLPYDAPVRLEKIPPR